MKLLEVINKLDKYRSDKRITPNHAKELAVLAIVELRNHYFFFSPTPKNLELKDAISKIVHYDGSILFSPKTEEYKSFHPYKEIPKFLKNKKMRVCELLNMIANNCILIEKTTEVLDYFESLDVIAKLSGSKKTSYREINFFEGERPIFKDGKDSITKKVSQIFKEKDGTISSAIPRLQWTVKKVSLEVKLKLIIGDIMKEILSGLEQKERTDALKSYVLGESLRRIKCIVPTDIINITDANMNINHAYAYEPELDLMPDNKIIQVNSKRKIGIECTIELKVPLNDFIKYIDIALYNKKEAN